MIDSQPLPAHPVGAMTQSLVDLLEGKYLDVDQNNERHYPGHHLPTPRMSGSMRIDGSVELTDLTRYFHELAQMHRRGFVPVRWYVGSPYLLFALRII